jgi:hypothetical protein
VLGTVGGGGLLIAGAIEAGLERMAEAHGALAEFFG